MASIKFSRSEFEKQIKVTSEIEDKIRLFGTPLDSVTKNELEIEIFPNRPDLLSLHGYLRAFKAFIGKETGLKKYVVQKGKKDYIVKVDKSVKEVRPYTSCAIVKNLNLDDERIKEIIELQEKLHATIGRKRKKVAIGVYPLEKINLPITYEARKISEIKFVPLGYEKEMTAEQIIRLHPAGKEYRELLKEHRVYPIFIDSKKKILSMPPIINSNETGRLTAKTRDIFIECFILF